jgi:hypothetical protein
MAGVRVLLDRGRQKSVSDVLARDYHNRRVTATKKRYHFLDFAALVMGSSHPEAAWAGVHVISVQTRGEPW